MTAKATLLGGGEGGGGLACVQYVGGGHDWGGHVVPIVSFVIPSILL